MSLQRILMKLGMFIMALNSAWYVVRYFVFEIKEKNERLQHKFNQLPKKELKTSNEELKFNKEVNKFMAR